MTELQDPTVGDLRVWHIPQVPGKSFNVAVESAADAKKVIAILANYDLFLLADHFISDYYNASGLEVFEDDGLDREWVEWEDPTTGVTIDDFEPEPPGVPG